MSFEAVKAYFEKAGIADRIQVFHESTASVQDAAEQLGVKPEQIGKTMAFNLKEGPIVIVVKGTARISNQKFKAAFHQKAKMVQAPDLPKLIGHPAGGVCPFALQPGVRVYLDESVKDEADLYPAAGLPNAALRLSLAELQQYSEPFEWTDVVKD